MDALIQSNACAVGGSSTVEGIANNRECSCVGYLPFSHSGREKHLSELLKAYPTSWGYDLSRPLPSLIRDVLLAKGPKSIDRGRWAEREGYILSRNPIRREYRDRCFTGNTLVMMDSDLNSDDALAADACAHHHYKNASRVSCGNAVHCPRCALETRAFHAHEAERLIRDEGRHATLITLSVSPICGEDPEFVHLVWQIQRRVFDRLRRRFPTITGGVFRYEVALTGFPRLEALPVFERDICNLDSLAYRYTPHLHLVVLSRDVLGAEVNSWLGTALQAEYDSYGAGLTASVDVQSIGTGEVSRTMDYLKKPMAVITANRDTQVPTPYGKVADLLRTLYADRPILQRWAFVQLNRVCSAAADFFRISTWRLFTKGKGSRCITRVYDAFGELYGKGGRGGGTDPVRPTLKGGPKPASRSESIQGRCDTTGPVASERPRSVAVPAPRAGSSRSVADGARCLGQAVVPPGVMRRVSNRIWQMLCRKRDGRAPPPLPDSAFKSSFPLLASP